jgi:SAM-dependent methyltransferase
MEHFVERRSCPGCDVEAYAVLRRAAFTAPEVWDFLERYYAGRVKPADLAGAAFEVRRCEACGLLWQAWILDADGARRLYEEWICARESLAKKTDADIALYEGYAAEAALIARRIGRRPGEIRVLDFGMGWGAWCRMAMAHGYDVAGFEVSPQRCAYARQRGVRVIESLDALERYDYIHCNQTLEHVPDPAETLARLAAALAPRGVVRLSVPDGRGMEEALAAPGWRAAKDALHPLEHVNCFTPDALEALAERVGLVDAPEPAPPVTGVRALRRRVRAVLLPKKRLSRGTTRCFTRSD